MQKKQVMASDQKRDKDEERKEAAEEESSAAPDAAASEAGAATDGEETEGKGPTGDDAATSSEDDDDEAPAAAQLGSSRYVMAGFFVTGMVAAFIIGRLLSAIWGSLAEARWFQKSVTVLARIGEEERSEYSTVLGGVIAIAAAFYYYRRADVRQWTDEVASELSKVTWPDKAEVTNSTVIVIVASAFATVYLALLDRFWGFVTNLVYGS